MNNRISLSEIGKKYIEYNKESQSKYYCGFLDYYEDFFYKYRNEKFTLIEIGVDKGMSLLIWQEYFKYAQIIGIDKKQVNLNEKRIITIEADVNTANLPELLKPYNENIRIIIDDCSHAWWQQRHNFETLYPLLKNNGYYVVEDIFMPQNGDYKFEYYEKYKEQKEPFLLYSIKKIKDLILPKPYNKIYNKTYNKSISSISFIPGAIIYKK